MLVHVIGSNKLSIYNDFVKMITDDPSNWEKIENGNNYISTSLISDEYMKTYGTGVVYGFNNLSYNNVVTTHLADAGTKRDAPENADFDMRKNVFQANINTVITVENMLEKMSENSKNDAWLWNEILLTRKNKETNEKIKPDYIVCFDNLNEDSLKAANYFNIPIYLIHKNAYSKLENVNLDNKNEKTETSHLKK